MAKKTYWGVFQRGKLVEWTVTTGKKPRKLALLFVSKHEARRVAIKRCKDLKKPNRVRPVQI